MQLKIRLFSTGDKEGGVINAIKRNISKLMKFQRVGRNREEFMKSIIFLIDPWKRMGSL